MPPRLGRLLIYYRDTGLLNINNHTHGGARNGDGASLAAKRDASVTTKLHLAKNTRNLDGGNIVSSESIRYASSI